MDMTTKGYLHDQDGYVAVEILAYDRNKFVTIRCDGALKQVRRGYLSRTENVMKRFPAIFWYQLPREVGVRNPTRKQAAEEMIKVCRRKETSYVFFEGGVRTEYDSIDKALRKFARTDGDCSLTRFKSGGLSSSCCNILSREDEVLYIFTHGAGRHVVKNRHLQKYGIQG